MASYLAVLTALAAVFAPVFAAPLAAPHPKIKIPTADAKEIVADSYIVVYNTDITAEVTASHVDFVNSIVAKRDSAVSVGATYKIEDFAGYQISADEATIIEIANKPEVCTFASTCLAITNNITRLHTLKKIKRFTPQY